MAEMDVPPSEITHFAQFALDEQILRAVLDSGYTQPTPIQALGIPVVLAGHDVMAAAQTGTGKTASFALPILQKLLPMASASASPARHPVRALILAPTRELASQVADNVITYGQFTPLKTVVVYGGTDMQGQVQRLRAGCEVLVATPGRLLDHVEQKNVQLGQVQFLVLDEADRMLDMGFFPDLMRILSLLPKQRQTLMFSATYSDDIKKLAQNFLYQPKSIEVARQNATSEMIAQTILHISLGANREEMLVQFLQQHLCEAGKSADQAIIFTNTRQNCAHLSRFLCRKGFKADAIHGDKSQVERLATLQAFKDKEISFLVATDVAARGLDISDLPMVINFELPRSAEDYVHRIGRTGRAGAQGCAYSLWQKGSEIDERSLNDIELLINKKLPKMPINDGQTSGQRMDPLFYMPYTSEGSAVALPAGQIASSPHVSANISAQSLGSTKKRPVAVLLGG